ncbi:hypothetical protein Tdes44962_MAKER09090 [Teratosphaeria destructans]|uniref:Uncharacterized protein n=1 Tax=Teratosphaeria destructans TaxID=418781 RepID=A0A9W7W3V5_9PEZI|nr:hypothetical protein Tdes44962_MAKER09090 [Teratosphaeria destructans]
MPLPAPQLTHIHTLLQRRQGFQFPPRQRLPLLRVLVVERLHDLPSGGALGEESLVEVAGLGAGGREEGDVGGGVGVVGREGGGVWRRGVGGGGELGLAFGVEVVNGVEIAVEVVGVGGGGVGGWWRVAEEEFALDVVFEDLADGAAFIGLSDALGVVPSSSGVGPQHLLAGGDARAAFLDGADVDLHAVDGFQERARDPLRDQRRRTGVLAELVDGEDAGADELGFGGGEVGEDETGTVAQDDAVGEVDGLEVLGLAWGGGYTHFLGAKEGVDGGGFSDVGVADEADGGFAARRIGSLGGVLEEELFEVVGGEDASAVLGGEGDTVELFFATDSFLVHPLLLLIMPVLEMDSLGLLCNLVAVRVDVCWIDFFLDVALIQFVVILAVFFLLVILVLFLLLLLLLLPLLLLLAVLTVIFRLVFLLCQSIKRILPGLLPRLVHLPRQLGRKESEIDLVLDEPIRPRGPLLRGHHIGLVDQEQIPLVRVDLLDVVLQVLGAEQQGIPRIDNLHDQITPLDDPPQLPPDLQIPLERRQQQIVDLLQLGQTAPPLQHAGPLPLIQLARRRALVPAGAAGHGQPLPLGVLLPDDAALLVGGQQVGVALVGVDDLDVVHLLGGEVGAGQLGGAEELVEGGLLGDGAHLDPVGLPLGGGDIVVALLVAAADLAVRGGGGLVHVGRLVPEAVVHEGVAEPDALLALGEHHDD